MPSPQRSTARLALLAVLLTLAGCVTPPAAAPGLPPATIDDLMAADQAFSAASAQLGFDQASAQFMIPNAIRLPQDAPPVFGRDNIVAALAATSRDYTVTWEPNNGQVAESGELGWTWGRYLAVDNNSGEPVSRGKYLNIWQRQPDGDWKVALDIGNQTPMPQ